MIRRALVLAAALVAGAAEALPPGARAADPPAAPGASSPFLAADSGDVLATWIEPAEPAASGGHRVRLARFAGDRWQPAVTVVESTALVANWADTPGVVVADDGAWIVWWLERAGEGTYAYAIGLARSRDRGASWSPLGRLNDDRVEAEHGFVAMVADRVGARAVWLDGRSTPAGQPMSLRTAAIGETVGASRLVDEAVCDCCPTAAVAVEGSVLVAFRDRSPEEIRDLRLLRLGGEGEIAATVVAPADGWRIAGCPVNGPALAAVGARVAVAWFTAPEDRARVAVALSTDGGRRFAPPTIVDDAAPLGRVGVALLPNGDAAVLWLARAGDGADGAEARLRRVRADGRAGPPLAVAATGAGRASGIPRLARSGDDLLVAWIEASGDAARLRAVVVTAGALSAP